MRTPLRTLIDRLDQISTLADEENQFLFDLVSTRRCAGSSFIVGEGLIDGLSEPTPCRSALRGFLEGLPHPILQILVVLISLGRDKHPNLRVAIQANCGILEDRDCCVRLIVNKRKRMEYLHAGILALPGAPNESLARIIQEELQKKRRAVPA